MAGAAFGDVGVSLLVAGGASGEIRIESAKREHFTCPTVRTGRTVLTMNVNHVNSPQLYTRKNAKIICQLIPTDPNCADCSAAG